MSNPYRDPTDWRNIKDDNVFTMKRVQVSWETRREVASLIRNTQLQASPEQIQALASFLEGPYSAINVHVRAGPE